MSDGFWGFLSMLVQHADGVAAAIIALGGAVMTWFNSRHLKKQDEVLAKHEQKVDAVAAKVVEAAKMRDDEIDLVRTGAFRQGHVAGQERAKSDFGLLGK